MNQFNLEDKNRLRRQQAEQAISLAMQGRWQEAVETNRNIIALFPDDAESYNRLGKALAEIEHYRESFEAYSRASELNPSNMIAQKNKKRMEVLAQRQTTVPGPEAQNKPSNPILPTTFIEETGKSGVTSLTQLAASEVLSGVIPGDPVVLRVDGNSLKVESRDGQYLGTVEPKMGLHLIRFMQEGNRYAAAVTASSDRQLRIIIHEVYQDPHMNGRPSFTAQGLPAAVRPYLRSNVALAEDDEESAYEPDFGEESEIEENDNEEEVPFEDDDDDDLDEEG